MGNIRARSGEPDGGAGLAAAVRVDTAAEERSANEVMLLDAALAAFVEKGFHGTSMRDIARRAGTSVSHSYYYFPSKHHMLWLIVGRVCRILLDDLKAAEAAAGPAPDRRLAALVRTHVLLHACNPDEAFVGNTELRSLHPSDKPRVDAMRERVSEHFRRAIDDGRRQGLFHSPEPVAELTLAVVSMCTAVASWYRQDRGTSPDELADRYAAMILRMLDHRP